MTKLPRKISELILLFSYLVFSALAVFFLRPNYIISLFLIAGIPAFILLIKLKGLRRKIILESLVLVVPAVLPFDYISHISRTWYIPAVSGIKVLGAFPIEEFAWIFIYLLFTISVYEYFFDSSGIKKVSPKFKQLVLMLIFVLALFFIFLLLMPQLLNIRYFYFLWMAVFSGLTLVGFMMHPKLVKNILLLTAFLIVPSIIIEVVALELGHWYFPVGNHIGYIDLLGVTFPVEEGLFFIVAPCFTLLVHELFADNKKN